MKRLFFLFSMLSICWSCVENTVDSQHEAEQKKPRTLRSLVTRSSGMMQEDSLTVKSRLQSDVDNLMMGRVIMKDSIFVLAIKREDAIFLGVSEEVYDSYLNYVDRLNEHLENR